MQAMPSEEFISQALTLVNFAFLISLIKGKIPGLGEFAQGVSVIPLNCVNIFALFIYPKCFVLTKNLILIE
ncbi:MAG: hypothetical protein K0R73_1086 [Candidatus Midichloriaceae bacterium]|jgi:hypothetical protein|nr:hypothetical protein [Candidatus Midichloriaceae bacterium]